jgi:hypothetical protein
MKAILYLLACLPLVILAGCGKNEPDLVAQRPQLTVEEQRLAFARSDWKGAIRSCEYPDFFQLLLPEYTNSTGYDDRYSSMLADGAWWHSIEFRLSPSNQVVRSEIYQRIRDSFATNNQWRVATRQLDEFGAEIISLGEDDLWCELIPYFGLYDRDIWCIHVSDDAGSVCVYTRSYWGIGRKKPEEPTTKSTLSSEAAPSASPAER